MKKVIFMLALPCALLLSANTASAKGIFIYSNGEKIEVVQEITEELIEDEHVNLGVMYEQFSLMWIPVWNYGETKYVLVNDAKDTYYDLSAEELDALRTDLSLDIPEKPTIGFWNKIGGKLIWGAVLIFVLWGWISGRKDD